MEAMTGAVPVISGNNNSWEGIILGALLTGGFGGVGRNNVGVSQDHFLSREIQGVSNQVQSESINRGFGDLNNAINCCCNNLQSQMSSFALDSCRGQDAINTNVCNSTRDIISTNNQNTSTVLLANQQNTAEILQAVAGIGSKLDQNTINILTADKASLEAQLRNVTTQAQLQQQISDCCCNNQAGQAQIISILENL